MAYDHFEHRHRFAAWAAARAAQRGLTSTDVLCAALEASALPEFVRRKGASRIDAASFERQHRSWCRSILKFLKRRGIKAATYGRAAKLVAIYLKAMVVVGPGASSSLAAVAHPPIDSILLKCLAANPGVQPSLKPRLHSTVWTKLDERDYYSLIVALRSVLAPSDPWWKLEEFWNVSSTRSS